MIKAILWANKLHILGPGMSVAVEEAAIALEQGRSTIQVLNFANVPKLIERMANDKDFKESLPRIIGLSFVKFFESPDMAVMDLAGTILKTRIESPKPKLVEAPNIEEKEVEKTSAEG